MFLIIVKCYLVCRAPWSVKVKNSDELTLIHLCPNTFAGLSTFTVNYNSQHSQ